MIMMRSFKPTEINRNNATIQPNKALELSKLKLNNEQLLELPIVNLKSNHYYKILVHFIGALGINFNITVICDDIHQIKSTYKRNIEQNDFNEYDFKTNERRIPLLCGIDYNYDKVLISIIPYSITYQLKPEEEMEFGAYLELTQSITNTDTKFINIIMNKNLYVALLFILIILPIALFIFRNSIRRMIFAIINEKIEKTN